MRGTVKLFLALAIATIAFNVSAQNPAATEQQLKEAAAAFDAGNAFMEQRKPAEALTSYKQALAVLPNESALLFNGGLAAYGSKDYAYAAELWKRSKSVDSSDWHVRAKLIQAYQALGKLAERDAERAELFELWKAGQTAELKQQFQFCRDQFEIKSQKVMAFEHFELKGARALRYVFSILNAAENGEQFRISLGSYDMTNAIWRETRDPKPKEGERLFHLDGYFKGGHATYGMYFPEPSYDDIRRKVIEILEGKGSPISSSTAGSPTPKPESKPKP